MHSDIVGGSTCGRLIACPGSYALGKSVPKPPGSDFANEGTMLHQAIETVLMTDDLDIETLIGFENLGQVLTTDHLGEAIIPALRFFDDICDQYQIEAFDCEVKADWESEIPGAFGSIDVCGKGPEHNLIFDWKFGRGIPVHAENNKQLMFYAAGAMLNDDLADLFDPNKPTILAICQPRVEDGNSTWEIDTPKLMAFVETVKAAVRKAQQPDAPLATGSHCRWCPARSVCPKKIGMAKSVDTKQATFDGKQLAELLPLADEMETWAKSVRAAAHHLLEDGATVPGYKLVAKKATRKWIDEELAKKRLRGLKLKVADITDSKLKSPAQIEKVLKAAGKNVEVVGELADAKSTGTTLAREDDKRPAISTAFGAGRRKLAETLS